MLSIRRLPARPFHIGSAHLDERPASVARNTTRVRLRDGASVCLRDATDADQPHLRALFYTLSATTRYLYFCAGVPATEVWAERVARLGASGGVSSYAMVVEADVDVDVEAVGAVVGVARFDRAAEGNSAEIGILLTDAWQSRGIGREVVARLRREASSRTLAGFTATVLGENRRAMRLLRRAFPQMRAMLAYGQYEVEMPFGERTTEDTEVNSGTKTVPGGISRF